MLNIGRGTGGGKPGLQERSLPWKNTAEYVLEMGAGSGRKALKKMNSPGFRDKVV